MRATIKDAEISAEQRRVDQAYLRLEEMRADARRMIEEGYRLAQAGTRASLVDRDAMVYQASLRAQALDVAEDGLVFGRLDLKDDQTLYVGRIGVRTRDHDSLVIDWRAPAAEAFYRATPEDPRGVVRRRVIHSRGRRVVDLEDDLLDPAAGGDLTVVGDGAFLASLARTREGTMRDIVATIQREQDEVIRAPADATVIVRGGPGTGKTAVALHRVAYLLFRHRRRFGSRGVLIVGPNPRFTAYIERVLPSLGEKTAALRSLGDLVPGVLATFHDAPDVARLKGAAEMSRAMRRAVEDAPPTELRITHQGVVVVIGSESLGRIRQEVHRRAYGAVNGAAPRAADLLLDALWERYTGTSSRASFVHDIRDQRRFTDFLDAWWPVRRPIDVLRNLKSPQRLRAVLPRHISEPQIVRLSESFDRDTVSYQDVPLLDEIDAILGPPPPKPVEEDEVPDVPELSTAIERMERAARRDDGAPDVEEYAHIVVDEAQDLSPMQWRMLGRRGRQSTWTIVDDPAQSAWEDPAASRMAMDKALGKRPRHSFELTTNYRNSAEIAELAARVLERAAPGARPARAVRTSGHRPRIRRVTDIRAAARDVVAELLAEVEGTIGVIVPVGYSLVLPDVPERVQVLDALEAKGLEFDACLIVEPGAIAGYSPTGLRTLYVAVSRATQRLTILSTGPLDQWGAAEPGHPPDRAP